VVAHGRCLEVQGVEDVDGRLVVLRGGCEQGRADVVTRRQEDRVTTRGLDGGALLLDGAGEGNGVGIDAAVEVVDVGRPRSTVEAAGVSDAESPTITGSWSEER